MHFFTCKHRCSNVLVYYDSTYLSIITFFFHAQWKDNWHLAQVWKLYLTFSGFKAKNVTYIFTSTCDMFIACCGKLIYCVELMLCSCVRPAIKYLRTQVFVARHDFYRSGKIQHRMLSSFDRREQF